MPDINAPAKQVSDTSYPALGEADVYASQDVLFTEFGWEFFGEELSFIIFSVDASTQVPARLDINGFCQDLWVAVADYGTGGWRWLRNDGFHSSAMLTLSDGSVPPPGSVSEAGVFYLLLVSPIGYSVGEASFYLHMVDGEGDNDAPTWTGVPGVKSFDPVELSSLEWDAAEDPSGIESYAVFVAPAAFGIDWSAPLGFVPGDVTACGLSFPDEGYAHAAAVLAIDTAGNVTAPPEPFLFTMPDTEEPDALLATAYPGDRILAEWDNPARDVGIGMLSPTWDEGYPVMGSDYNGRSFICGPDSLDSGLAEEWVQLGILPPSGLYELSLDFFVHPDSEPFDVRLKVFRADGTLRQNLGAVRFDEPFVGFTLVGRVHVPLAE